MNRFSFVASPARAPTTLAILLMAGMLTLAVSARPAAAALLVEVAPHRATRAPVAASSSPSPAPPLFGYLTHPKGHGPFAAVIALHGCGGFGPADVAVAERLKREGYLALALDSLGDTFACRGPGGSRAEAEDALAALHYLAARRDVNAARIAVLGFSMGGNAVLDLVRRGGMAPTSGPTFRAAVAYYPFCGRSLTEMTTPLLILMGSADDWTPAPRCEAMMERRAGRGAPVTLKVYPGATHAFNTPERERTILGHVLRYDPAAAKAAQSEETQFLRAELAPPGGP